MKDKKTAVVVGVGPGLGRAVAARFGAEGFTVVLVARDASRLAEYRSQLEKAGTDVGTVSADAAEPESTASGFQVIREKWNDPDVLVYNAGAFERGNVVDVSPEKFCACWEANCMGGFLCAREVLPAMLERGHGTILFTGATASLRGGAGFSCLAVGKFGLRALAQSLAREVGPKGIHVAHTVIDGQIDTPKNLSQFPQRERDSFLSSDAIAEEYWRLHTQDRTTWTLELDLRPYAEKF